MVIHIDATDRARPSDTSLKWWWAATVAWAAFILFGSWYPFNFHEGTFLDAWNEWKQGIFKPRLSRPDLAVNLLLGIPLGFFLGLAIEPLRSGRASGRILLALVITAIVFCLGTFVELGQFWLGGRVVSFSDTAAQTAGGLLGVFACLVGGNWFLTRFHAFVSDRQDESPLTVVLELYLAGYAIWC